MIYIVVHLYVLPGALKQMKKYENKALKIFRKNGGEVVSAFQPDKSEKAESLPDEIQILRMNSKKEFELFLKDPERLKLAEERIKSVRKTKVFITKKMIKY